MLYGKEMEESHWPIKLDEQIDAAQRAEVVMATLDALPDHHRAVIVLRYLDERPVAEVAELIGKSLPATESVLARARRAFRREYLERFAAAD